jgi:sorting nexin-13
VVQGFTVFGVTGCWFNNAAAFVTSLLYTLCIVCLNIFTDELKHIIGSETTRRGLLCVFELFQHPVLNRRLLYVLLEGILETLFPQHNLSQIFRKLHSRSARVRDDFKTSQRTRSDLRR